MGVVVLGRSDWSQEVPLKVLGEMLGESLSQVKSWSQVVSSSPVWNPTERTPSPYSLLPRKSSEVPFSSEGGTFQRLGGPGSSQKVAGWIKSVWVEVWVEIDLVWVDKMRVGGMLGCRSLTQKSVP